MEHWKLEEEVEGGLRDEEDKVAVEVQARSNAE